MLYIADSQLALQSIPGAQEEESTRRGVDTAECLTLSTLCCYELPAMFASALLPADACRVMS